MSWRCYIGDTMTGLIDRPVDVPNFSWTVEVSDSALSTTKSGEVESVEWSSVTVPWTAISESDPAARSQALSTSRRCLALLWEDGSGSVGTPLVWGAIGTRTDTWTDTSFSLDSPVGILSQRLAVPELTFGAGEGSTSTARTVLSGSWRSIACQLVRMCCDSKPAGSLPIDLPYLDEGGSAYLGIDSYDVGNLACSDLLDQIAAADGGPDIQIRPYLADSSHVRLRLVAGTDDDPGLPQSEVRTLTCFPGGGTMQEVSVDRTGPVMRVYGTGSGTDAAQLCHLSEDLSLCQASDPWPISEAVASNSDLDTASAVASMADAYLIANRSPLCQLSCEVDLNDPLVPGPGEIWPGELVDLALDGFPTLPDGTYRCRLMRMSGDQSSVVSLKFDVMEDPTC